MPPFFKGLGSTTRSLGCLRCPDRQVWCCRCNSQALNNHVFRRPFLRPNPSHVGAWWPWRASIHRIGGANKPWSSNQTVLDHRSCITDCYFLSVMVDQCWSPMIHIPTLVLFEFYYSMRDRHIASLPTYSHIAQHIDMRLITLAGCLCNVVPYYRTTASASHATRTPKSGDLVTGTPSKTRGIARGEATGRPRRGPLRLVWDWLVSADNSVDNLITMISNG